MKRDPAVTQEILWEALKIVCKSESHGYYSEQTWQEILKNALRQAKREVAACG